MSLSDPAADRARCVGDEPLLTGSPTTSTTSRPPRQPGYLGYTSYSRVFEEATSRLSLLAGPGTQDIQRNQEVAQTHPDISFPSLPLPLRDTCLLVLRTLPGQANERIVFPDQPPSTSPKGWAHITVDRIIRSLRDDYGDMLAAGDAGLETMAEILCRNTARQFQDHYSDSQLWLGQLYGPNLRWESLGLLWAHLLGISDVVDAFVGRSIEWVDGKGSMETGLVCLDYCVEISRHFTEANDVLLDLSRRRSTLDSMIHGDGRKYRALLF